MITVFHNRLGYVDFNVVKVDKAVEQYDERLFLDKHPETKDWVVYIRMERPAEPYPVLGLGWELPQVHEVIQKLRESDSRREEIRQRMLKYNADLQKQREYAIQEEVKQGAELAEFISRKEYRAPETKSYRKVNKKTSNTKG